MGRPKKQSPKILSRMYVAVPEESSLQNRNFDRDGSATCREFYRRDLS
ncbi:hypothetical protein ABIB30_000479 [Pedobacter sp. UYP1]